MNEQFVLYHFSESFYPKNRKFIEKIAAKTNGSNLLPVPIKQIARTSIRINFLPYINHSPLSYFHRCYASISLRKEISTIIEKRKLYVTYRRFDSFAVSIRQLRATFHSATAGEIIANLVRSIRVRIKETREKKRRELHTTIPILCPSVDDQAARNSLQGRRDVSRGLKKKIYKNKNLNRDASPDPSFPIRFQPSCLSIPFRSRQPPAKATAKFRGGQRLRRINSPRLVSVGIRLEASSWQIIPHAGIICSRERRAAPVAASASTRSRRTTERQWIERERERTNIRIYTAREGNDSTRTRKRVRVKERGQPPKLGCNYSRLACKLSSCHSYPGCRVQLRRQDSKLLPLPSARLISRGSC